MAGLSPLLILWFNPAFAMAKAGANSDHLGRALAPEPTESYYHKT